MKEKIILFGASNLGEIAYNLLKSEYEICYFCDNDEKKWGKSFCSKSILSPQELKDIKGYKIIITSSYFLEIKKQLKKLGITEVQAFKCGSIIENRYVGDYFFNDIYDYSNYYNFNINPKFKAGYINNFSLLYGNKYSKHVYTKQDKFKKVLIIAYSFPPVGGAGVQRTLKFVKYLKHFGWEPIIVTVGKTYGLMYRDKSLLNDIEDNVNIIRIDHTNYNVEDLNYDFLQQLINLYYGMIDNNNLMDQYINKINTDKSQLKELAFIPDSFICWANVVLSKIESLVDMNYIDLVFSTASPEVDHIIAYYLKKKYNKPWVAEFRDEWTNNPYYLQIKNKCSLKYKMERALESSMLYEADKIISVTPISTKNYMHNFNISSKKLITLTNGYDEEDFKNLQLTNKEPKFIIIANGSLYSVRVPYSFIRAVNYLIEIDLIDKNKIEIRFTDDIEINIKDNIFKMDIYGIVKIIPYMEHIESLREAIKADVLLLVIGRDDEVKSVYTGKVFEYLRLKKPILSISPKGSVVDDLLQATNCGRNYDYDNIIGMADYILTLYNEWIEGRNSFEPNEEEIIKYDRRNLTKKLKEIFDELVYEGK